MSAVASSDNEITIEELENTFPEAVLTTIIYPYVPLIDFIWEPLSEEWGRWNTDIKWQGPLTCGHWWMHGVDLSLRPNVMELFSIYLYCRSKPKQEEEKEIHEFATLRLDEVISTLEGYNPTRPCVSFGMIHQLVRRFFCGYQHTFPFSSNYKYFVPWLGHNVKFNLNNTWIVKCDIEELIKELKFVWNTVTSHPRYNAKYFQSFFQKREYKHVMQYKL